jgi:hypothetical protein
LAALQDSKRKIVIIYNGALSEAPFLSPAPKFHYAEQLINRLL